MHPNLVELPCPDRSPFWQSHVEYLINSAKALPNTEVRLSGTLQALNPLQFQIRIDGQLGLLDIRDGTETTSAELCHAYAIRLTYTNAHAQYRTLIPFPTISFHDWILFAKLSQETRYAASGDVVLANFDPRLSDANRDTTHRRLYVQGLLRHVYDGRADFERTDQISYWQKAARSFVTVHVPGYCNHKLDRSQHQLFGLGVCTVSPVISTYLGTHPPEPWEHYVPCADDYGDLIEKIEWCRAHRPQCVQIGNRAGQFFQQHSTPAAMWARVSCRLASVIS